MQTAELLQRIELGIRTQDLLATLDALEGVSSQLEVESIRLARTHSERRGAVQLVAALLRLEERSSSDPDRKASLFFELAQLQQAELLDDDGARSSLERASALRPGDEAIHEQLEQLRESSTRFAEFAKRYCEHAAQASDANLKATLLTSAARILFKYDRARREEAIKLLDEALAIEKGSGTTLRLYALLAAPKVAAETLFRCAEHVRTREERVGIYAECARLASSASELQLTVDAYARVLDYAPGYVEAMEYLSRHYTELEDWDHLAALYEDALKSKQRLENEPGILLQVAMVHYRDRKKPEDAEPFFARLRRLDPANPATLDFYREFFAKDDEPSTYLNVLADAQRVSRDPEQRRTLQFETARVAGSRKQSDRAIEAWRTILRAEPANDEAFDGLRKLYRATEKWNALAELLKTRVESLENVAAARVPILREMIEVYRDHLRLDAMAVQCWNAILLLRPDDEEALAALVQIYESTGRYSDLIGTLNKRASMRTDPQEKSDEYMRVARIWLDRFANQNQAIEPLETAFSLTGDIQASTMLRDIYAKKRAWQPLVDHLQALLRTPNADARALRLEIAALAAERLQQGRLAIEQLREVARDDADENVLLVLEKTAERERDHAALAFALEKQRERIIAHAVDPSDEVRLLTKLGNVYAELLLDADKASAVFTRVLELEPRNHRAMRSLRESVLARGDYDGLASLYTRAGDLEGLAEALGNAADRAVDREQKIKLSLRAAAVYEDELKEPTRAFRSYERVLAVDPKNETALRKLIPLYESTEKWSRLVPLYEALIDNGNADSHELASFARLASVAAERSGDTPRAYQHAESALSREPSEESVARAEAMAERAGMVPQLAEVLARLLANRDVEKSGAIALRARLVHILRDRLSRPQDALVVLREQVEYLVNQPDVNRDYVAGSLRELETLADRLGDLDAQRDVLERRVRIASSASEKAEVMLEAARREETEFSSRERARDWFSKAVELVQNHGAALSGLERISLLLGDFTTAKRALVARLLSTTIRDAQLELTTRIAELAAYHTGEPEEAERMFAEVLGERAQDERAVAGLEHISHAQPARRLDIGRILESTYEARGEWGKLRAVLEHRSQHTDSEEEKRALTLRFARAHQQGGDAKSAYATLEQAFRQNPSDRSLWAPLEHAAESANAYEQLASAIDDSLAAKKLHADEELALTAKLAAIFDDTLGEPQKSEPYHKRLLQRDPANPKSFSALKQLYATEERWNELLALYQNRLQSVDGDQQRLELLLQASFLFDEHSQDQGLAIRCYEDVLALDRGNAVAAQGLERLYRKSGKYGELANVLLAFADAKVGHEQVAPLERLGLVYENELQDAAQAVRTYGRVLDVDGGSRNAIHGLERLLSSPIVRQECAARLATVYENAGDHRNWVRVLEVELEAPSETQMRVARLVRIAKVSEEHLRLPNQAFESMARAVALTPGELDLRSELARLATECRVPKRHAEVLEVAVDSAGDARAEVLYELARVYDVDAFPPERSEHAYDRMLLAAQSEPELRRIALAQLSRFAFARADYEKGKNVLRQEAELALSAGEREDFLRRLAGVLEENLADVDGAIAVHQERLVNAPELRDARQSLARLLEGRARFPELLQVLEEIERDSDDDAQRRALLEQMADLAETRLGDLERAVSIHNDIMARYGPDVRTLSALSRLYEAKENWPQLFEIVQLTREYVSDEDDRRELRYWEGELLRVRLHESARATEVHADLLHDGFARSQQPLLAIFDATADEETRLAVARILMPYRMQHIPSRTSPVEREVDWRLWGALRNSSEPSERQAALLGSLEQAQQLSRPERCEIAFALVRENTGDARIEEFLEYGRQAAAADRGETQLRAWVSVLSDVAADLTPELRARCTLEQGALLESVGDGLAAISVYANMAAEMPDNVLAFENWERLLREHARHGERQEVLNALVELRSGAKRGETWVLMAENAEQNLSDLDGAISHYESALFESDDLVICAHLERLYTVQARHSDRVNLYDRMLDRKLGNAVEVRFKLGSLYQDALQDSYAAIEQFERAIGMGAPHEPTVQRLEGLLVDGTQRARAATLLEPIYLARLAWDRVREVREIKLAEESGLDERKALLRKIAEVFEDYRTDFDGALETHVRLYREDKHDESALEAIARLAKVALRPETTAALLESVVEQAIETRGDVRIAVLAADMWAQRLAAPERAIGLYTRVLEFSPAEPGIASTVERLAIESQNWDAALGLYRAQENAAPSDQARAVLVEKRAIIERDRKANVGDAIDAYRELLDLEPAHPRAGDALLSLYEKAERYSELADLLRDRSAFYGAREEGWALAQRLALVLREHLSDMPAALDALENVLRDNPKREPTVLLLEQWIQEEQHQERIIDILEPVYASQDQWRKRIALLEARSRVVGSDSMDRATWLREVASLHEHRGGDLARAFHAYARALEAQPSDSETLDNLVRVAGLLEEWTALCDVLRNNAERGDLETEARIELYRVEARVQDEHRGDPRAAVASFERILALDSARSSALEAIEKLQTMMGDWPGVVTTLERRIPLEEDVAKQGDLWRQGGRLLADQMSDRVRAAQFMRNAVSLDANDALAWEALDGLYTSLRETDQLVVVLERRVELEDDAAARAELLVRISILYDEDLRQIRDAMRAAERCLEEVPDHPQALLLLPVYYERECMWPELLGNLRHRIRLTSDPSQRLELSYRTARLLWKEMNEPREAVLAYESVLAEDANHQGSQTDLLALAENDDVRQEVCAVLLPLLIAQERWVTAAQLKELHTNSDLDATDKHGEFVELAEIYETHLADKDKAWNSFARALAANPRSRPALNGLVRLAGELNRRDQTNDVLTDLASRETDAEAAEDLYRILGQQAMRDMHDETRAIMAFSRVLDYRADDEQALAALSELYKRAQRHNDLIRTLERREELSAEEAQRIELRTQRADTLRIELVRSSDALPLYRASLEHDPLHAASLVGVRAALADETLFDDAADALEMAYQRAGNVRSVTEILQARAARLSNGPRKAEAFARLAEQLQEIGATEDIVAARSASFLAEVEDLSALERLFDAALKYGVDDNLWRVPELAVAGGVTDALALEILRHAHSFASAHDPRFAEKFARMLIARDAASEEHHDYLLQALAALDAATVVRVAAAADAARNSDDGARKAVMYEFVAASAAADDAALAEAVDWLLAADPHHRLALSKKLASLPSQSASVFDEYDSVVARLIEVATDADERREYLVVRAENAERHRVQDAIARYEDLLEAFPDHEGALAALERLYGAENRLQDLARLAAHRLDRATTPTARRAATRTLAALEGKRQNFDEAERLLTEMLQENSGDAEDVLVALELVRLAEARGDNEALLHALGTYAQLAQKHNASEQRAIALKQKALLEQDLRGAEIAAETWGVLHQEAPSLENRSAYANALRACGRDRDAFALDAQELDEVEVGQLAAVSDRLLAVARQINGADLEETILRTCQRRGLDVSNVLEAFYQRTDAHANLAALLVDRARGDASSAVELLTRAAELYRKVGQTSEAEAALQDARKRDPSSKVVLQALSELYVASGRAPEAKQILSAMIDSFAGKRSKEVAGLYHRLGNAHEAEGLIDEALAAYEAAFRIDISNVAILRDLSLLAYRHERLDIAKRTLQSLLVQKLGADTGITKSEVFMYLGDVLAKQGDPKKGISMLERAVAESPQNKDAQAMLERMRASV